MTWGAKVSQPGVEVTQAADYQLAFSSEWPTIKIYKSQPFYMTDISKKQVIYSHGLQYPPAFMIQTTNTSGLARIAGPGNDEWGDGFYVDDDNLGFDPASLGSPTGAYTGRFFIFAYNLLINYQSPIFTIGTSSLTIGGTQREGIIASVPSTNAIVARPQDLSVDSEAKAPLVHMSLNGPLTSNGIDYSLVAVHALDYPPWFMTFLGTQGVNTYKAFFGGRGNDILVTSPTTVEQHSLTTGLQGTIIILKDPFFL